MREVIFMNNPFDLPIAYFQGILNFLTFFVKYNYSKVYIVVEKKNKKEQQRHSLQTNFTEGTREAGAREEERKDACASSPFLFPFPHPYPQESLGVKKKKT